MNNLILWILLIVPTILSGQSIVLTEARKLIHDSPVIWPREKSSELDAILRKLPSKDLIQLMDSDSPLERVYGFWGYVRKEDADYRKFFQALVVDTAKVSKEQYGCRWAYPEAVGKFVFDIAEDLEKYNRYPAYPDFLDSIALEITSYEDIRGNINCRIMNIQSPGKLYDKVRERALQGDTPSIIGLSSYNKEQDTSIIKDILNIEIPGFFLYGLMCVEQFPHAAFEKDLLSIYNGLVNQKYPLLFSYLCQVLRNYTSQDVETAFTELISNPDKYPNHIVLLWLSFERNKEIKHPIRIRMEKIIGKKEIKKRVAEYNKLDFWKLANEEIRGNVD